MSDNRIFTLCKMVTGNAGIFFKKKGKWKNMNELGKVKCVRHAERGKENKDERTKYIKRNKWNGEIKKKLRKIYEKNDGRMNKSVERGKKEARKRAIRKKVLVS